MQDKNAYARYIHVAEPNPVINGSPASYIYAQCIKYGSWKYYEEAIDALRLKDQWPYGFQEQYDYFRIDYKK